MAIRHIADEDRRKATAIFITFVVVFVGSLWYTQTQEWVLIVQVSLALVVMIAFALVYDRYVIR